MKKIAVLGSNVLRCPNHEALGKILSPQFHLDLLANKEQITEIKNHYHIKSYTNIKGQADFSWTARDFINLTKYCFKEKPDVIFAIQRPIFQAPLAVLFGKIFRTKIVTRFSGGSFNDYKIRKGLQKVISYFTYKWFMRNIFLADKIICMSEEHKKEMLNHGCKPEKIVLLIQPIDPELFYPPTKNQQEIRKELNLPLNAKIILYVGSLQQRKGISSFVNTLPMILKEQPNTFFLFVGRDDDNYLPPLRQAGKNHIIFREMVPYNEIHQYYQAADLLVHPAHIEGFPRTVLEAAACGLPSIARDIVGIGRIADKTFQTDQEMLNLILNNNLKFTNQSRLPEKYTWSSLSKEYITLFRNLTN